MPIYFGKDKIEGVSVTKTHQRPYIEETYNANGELTSAVMYGHAKVRDYMFEHCSSLVSVDIPSGVTNIGDRAFYNCYSLALTELPSQLISIE